LPQRLLPRGDAFRDDAGECDTGENEKLLVDVKHQILEVSVHTRQRVDCRLLIRNQVVKLHDSDGDGLKLLRFYHDLLEEGVLNHLVSDNHRKLARLSHVPPVIAKQGGVGVVTQALHSR